jgi:ribonuclease P protein component
MGCEPDCGPDRRLNRPRRITASKDFRETYDQGRSWRGRHMVLWIRRAPGATLRLGVVASRKVGGSVQRAWAKRRLREAYRLQRAVFRGECDVVLIARRSLLTAAWAEVVKDLQELAGRAGLSGATASASGRTG